MLQTKKRVENNRKTEPDKNKLSRFNNDETRRKSTLKKEENNSKHKSYARKECKRAQRSKAINVRWADMSRKGMQKGGRHQQEEKLRQRTLTHAKSSWTDGHGHTCKKVKQKVGREKQEQKLRYKTNEQTFDNSFVTTTQAQRVCEKEGGAK